MQSPWTLDFQDTKADTFKQDFTHSVHVVMTSASPPVTGPNISRFSVCFMFVKFSGRM